jgi:hypothetical protein
MLQTPTMNIQRRKGLNLDLIHDKKNYHCWMIPKQLPKLLPTPFPQHHIGSVKNN